VQQTENQRFYVPDTPGFIQFLRVCAQLKFIKTIFHCCFSLETEIANIKTSQGNHKLLRLQDVEKQFTLSASPLMGAKKHVRHKPGKTRRTIWSAGHCREQLDGQPVAVYR
jgi:hypothetical protein